MLCKAFFIPVSSLSTSLCNTWALSCYLSDSDKPTATPDLPSKINTICLVAVISFQTLPSTAAFVVVIKLLYLGLKCVTFKEIKIFKSPSARTPGGGMKEITLCSLTFTKYLHLVKCFEILCRLSVGCPLWSG